ncbi:hypothetical protein [Pelagibius marinus]|uniref:hypothetical protein n=1 Tax=Pelagibius marinus TaxID=2762760 RepID=UPI0018722FFD|nr:hypothetical protein [Pelagibius marinus]
MPGRPATRVPKGGLLTRAGRATWPGERTFWILGHSQAEFEGVTDLVEALMERYPRVDMLFTAPEPATRDWLQRRFPAAMILPPPLPFTLAGGRYLLNLNVRGLMILGAPTRGDRAVLRAAGKRALPCVGVEVPDPAGVAGAIATAEAWGKLPERIDHFFAAAPATTSRLEALGIDVQRITLLPAEGTARDSSFIPVLAHLLMQDLKLIRSKQRPFRRAMERLCLRAIGHPRLRRLLADKARRFDDIEALREALGNPGTILCLGNGPTSEDPAVAEVRHDCLFRVNDLWLTRGFLTEPDMVFTGSKGTLALVKGAIFGLYSIKSEARLVVAPLLRPWIWGFRYATIERFRLFLSEPRWQDVRPTNGAVMLVTAAALQPARLVVSGIDLFSHPAGSYPGDTTTPNAYTPGHNPESELEILLEALSRYRGELTILSPALREQWEAFKSGAPRGDGQPPQQSQDAR